MSRSYDDKNDEKVTSPKVEGSLIHIENPNEILLDYGIELERSSKVENLGKFVYKILKSKSCQKKRHFFNGKFSETFVEKLKKFFGENQAVDFKIGYFEEMVPYATKRVILLNYKKKRKRQSKEHICRRLNNCLKNGII